MTRVAGGAEALVAAAGPLAVVAAVVTGQGWATPLLAGTAAWAYLVLRREGPRLRLIGGLLCWAAALAASVSLLTAWSPGEAGALIPRGPEYWAEMKPWLWTGEGKEARPAQFVPEHVLHLVAFGLLTLVSGGWLGLVLGAFLLGYMSFYVGQVALLADAPAVGALLAWHPWAVLRVIAFVTIGVSLARLLLERPSLREWAREERLPLLAGAGLWIADLLLKTLMAPHWWRVIRAGAGIEG
jgi:hypothetical protein